MQWAVQLEGSLQARAQHALPNVQDLSNVELDDLGHTTQGDW